MPFTPITTTEQMTQLKEAIAGGKSLKRVLSEKQQFEIRKWLYVLRYRLFKLENDIPPAQSAHAEFQAELETKGSKV